MLAIVCMAVRFFSKCPSIERIELANAGDDDDDRLIDPMKNRNYRLRLFCCCYSWRYNYYYRQKSNVQTFCVVRFAAVSAAVSRFLFGRTMP